MDAIQRARKALRTPKSLPELHRLRAELREAVSRPQQARKHRSSPW